jgi:hypothetical protein
MKTLTGILIWLQGKKTSLATILGAINVYLLAEKVINTNQSILFATILLALGLGANVATYKLVKK